MNGNVHRLMTTTEVADVFRVDRKTVTTWAKAGKLASVRTLGGCYRFRREDVLAMVDFAPEEER